MGRHQTSQHCKPIFHTTSAHYHNQHDAYCKVHAPTAPRLLGKLLSYLSIEEAHPDHYPTDNKLQESFPRTQARRRLYGLVRSMMSPLYSSTVQQRHWIWKSTHDELCNLTGCQGAYRKAVSMIPAHGFALRLPYLPVRICPSKFGCFECKQSDLEHHGV